MSPSNLKPSGAALYALGASPGARAVTPVRPAGSRNILVIDDCLDIHGDFRKVLAPYQPKNALASLEADLFGGSAKSGPTDPPPFNLTFATQGEEGCEVARHRWMKGNPFVTAFVDMRMPPGIDGVETAVRLLVIQPTLRVVICSAYSDFSWREVIRRIGRPDLRLLRKPFAAKELLDLAWSSSTPPVASGAAR